jgi:hypothetical protein
VTVWIGVRRALPWLLCTLSLALFLVANWVRWILRDDTPDDHVEWLEGIIGALGFAGIPVVGALIAARLPANPYGWVWCAAGLAYASSEATGSLVRLLDGSVQANWLLEAWGFVSFIGLLVFVFLLFPSGRLPGSRWRWPARAAVTGTVLLLLLVPFMTDPADPAQTGPWALPGVAGQYVGRAALVVLYGMFGLVLLAMASLLVRFRRAGPVERRQLTWFLYATVVNGVLIVFDVVLGVLPVNLVTTVVSAAGFALLPVAVGVAVLRYRLYEIDRIVSRTVSYTMLSAGLVGLYLVVVAVLRPLLEPLTGSSALAVAGSTLAVAAVFNPARRRLQAAVDRRFDRARYDAARAVDAFAARLRVQVDLDEITAGLRDTVTVTVAPTRVGIWLTGPTGPRDS